MDTSVLDRVFSHGLGVAGATRFASGNPVQAAGGKDGQVSTAEPTAAITPTAASCRAGAARANKGWRRGRRWLGCVGLVMGLLLCGRSALPSPFMREMPPQMVSAAPASGEPGQGTDNAAHRQWQMKRIDQIRLGDRIRTLLPGDSALDSDDASVSGPGERAIDNCKITAEEWRAVELRLYPKEGGEIRLQLLRPRWWLERAGAQPGKMLDLQLLELQTGGPAYVLRIGPCTVDSRHNQRGEQIVTGTVVHQNAEVWDLTFDKAGKVCLGVTAPHPLYSHDRRGWVGAGKLRIGERVTALGKPRTLLGKTKRPGRHTVYNLEVHRTHAYYVSGLALLAHNSGVGDCGGTNNPGGGPQATAHGADRLADPARTLTQAEIAGARGGHTLKQADGATVYIQQVAPGKFNVFVEGDRGIITTFRHISGGALKRLAINYGWTAP